MRADQPHIAVPRKSGGVVLGRLSACDIRVGGGDVSLKHCQFSLAASADGREYLYLTDMSSNGTFLNDEVIGAASTALLKSGDKVAFARTGGEYIFRYAVDEVTARNTQKSFFDDYILGAQLGLGHYAVVREARDRHLGDVVAVKVFHPVKRGGAAADATNADAGGRDTDAAAAADKVAPPALQQEMALLLSISHPNIVKFISYYVEPTAGATATYLVLEKMNDGELFQRIVNKLKLRVDETRALFRQLLSGLGYLHRNNIIHRDIKPENILLDITPRSAPSQRQTGPWDPHELDIRVKIADFGLAKFIGELKFTNTLCGTPAYVAPEILDSLHDRNYLTKVDLWLAGVLLYVCLCGFPPFSDELAPPVMRQQILEGKYAFYSPYWDDIDDSALDLICSLLVVDAAARFDVKQTLAHYWFGPEAAAEAAPEAALVPAPEPVPEAAPHLPSEPPAAAPPLRAPLRANTQPLTLRQVYTSQLNFS